MSGTLDPGLREKRLHGTERFPLAVYEMGPLQPGIPVLELHWHDEAEIFYLIEGQTLFQIGTSYFTLHAGDAVFIAGGELHGAHAFGEHTCRYAAVVFDWTLLASADHDAITSKYIQPLMQGKYRLPSHWPARFPWSRSVLGLLLPIIDNSLHARPGHEMLAKAHLFLILHTLYTTNQFVLSPASTADKNRQDQVLRLKTVITYMQHHHAAPLRIADLAALIPMSEGQFCRFFKAMTRQTPIGYLNAYRISRACERLAEPHSKIADIALDVGFAHIGYFTKVFYKHMNCTPSQFRKRRRRRASM